MRLVRPLLVFCIMACAVCFVHLWYPTHAFCANPKIPWDKQECSPMASRLVVPVGCTVVAAAVLAWWETTRG